MSAYEYTSVATEDVSMTNTRMKNDQWESSVKTVRKAWVFHSEIWIVPLWGPGDLLFVSICEISEGIMGHVKQTGTRVLEPAEYPGFGHPQDIRVSSHTRTRHGFCPSGLCTRRVPGFRSPWAHLYTAVPFPFLG